MSIYKYIDFLKKERIKKIFEILGNLIVSRTDTYLDNTDKYRFLIPQKDFDLFSSDCPLFYSIKIIPHDSPEFLLLTLDEIKSKNRKAKINKILNE